MRKPEDFTNALPYFQGEYRNSPDIESTCVLSRYYRMNGDYDKFFSVALKNVAVDGCSEVCCELGAYYFDKADYEEASLWYYNAAFETKPVSMWSAAVARRFMPCLSATQDGLMRSRKA